ncbi:hypothetical protein ACFLT3_00900 [Chloroflexota bacterium]
MPQVWDSVIQDREVTGYSELGNESSRGLLKRRKGIENTWGAFRIDPLT